MRMKNTRVDFLFLYKYINQRGVSVAAGESWEQMRREQEQAG